MGVESESLFRNDERLGLIPLTGREGTVIGHGITTTRPPERFTSPFDVGVKPPEAVSELDARAAVDAALETTGRGEAPGLYGPGTKHSVEELKKGFRG